MTSLREAVDSYWDLCNGNRPYEQDVLLEDAARSLLSIREAAVYVSWCETHGLPATQSWPDDNWVCRDGLSRCPVVPVALVPAGLIGGETE